MRAMSVAMTVVFATFSSVCAAGEVPYEPSMVLIEGGSYPIGSAEGSASARPPHRVTLDPFLVDVYEVTNARFAAFLNTLEVTAKRDVRAGELRPDDVEGPDADRSWGGSGLASQKWRAPSATGGVLWDEESGLRRSSSAKRFAWR